MRGIALPLGDRLGEPVHEMHHPVGAPLEPDPAERVAEDGESGPGARRLAGQGEFDLDGGRGPRQALREHVRQLAQIVRVGRPYAGQP